MNESCVSILTVVETKTKSVVWFLNNYTITVLADEGISTVVTRGIQPKHVEIIRTFFVIQKNKTNHHNIFGKKRKLWKNTSRINNHAKGRIIQVPKLTWSPQNTISKCHGIIVGKLSKYSTQHLQSLAEELLFYINNSEHIPNNIRLTKNPGSLLYTVSNHLFTIVPTHATRQVLMKQLFLPTRHRHITAQDTYFNHNEGVCKQVKGAPIGMTITPVIAKIFMENLEKTLTKFR